MTKIETKQSAFTLAEGGRSSFRHSELVSESIPVGRLYKADKINPSRHPELVSGSIPVANCNSRETSPTGQSRLVILNSFQNLLPSRLDDNHETSPTERHQSVTLNLFQGLFPLNLNDNRDKTLTGQINIDRFRNKFGMTIKKQAGLGSKNNHRRAAFTLAEVLITLGIIGVVAAMTLPTLIQTYKKRVVETRLQKVYSVMNQAITLSTVENGETKTWEGAFGNNSSTTYEDILAWFNKYLAPYLKYTEVKQENGAENLLVYFPDGTALRIAQSLADMSYYLEPKCLDSNTCKAGANRFLFFFKPRYSEYDTEYFITSPMTKYIVNPGFETYGYAWDGTIDGAKYSTLDARYGCYEQKASLCTKLIQLNHWKIPDDYPYKF